MQLISLYREGIWFLLCVIDVFSKYALIVPLKDKNYIRNTKAFQKILGSDRNWNKMWVDKGSEIYNWSMKSWLQDKDKEMNSTINEEKSRKIYETFKK